MQISEQLDLTEYSTLTLGQISGGGSSCAVAHEAGQYVSDLK